MDNSSHSNELHWSWLLAAFLLFITLFIVFGDVLTFIVGAIVLIVIFAVYHNKAHKQL